MHPVEFQRKWTGVSLTEKSASQSHFIDLCHVLGVPTPTDIDPDLRDLPAALAAGRRARRRSQGRGHRRRREVVERSARELA